MEHKLFQHQKILQKMALTPKMKHSIQMLAMSINGLNDYIEAVLASNPFLEKKIHKQPKSVSYEYNDEIQDKKDVNPREYLLSQVRTLAIGEKELEMAEYLIYEMDDSGYVKSDLEGLARDFCTDVEKVEEILGVIQRLDPPGIGARDVKECLQLQLKRSGKADSLEYTIVSNFLSDLAINDIPKIANALGVEKERVRHAGNSIKKLNPRPGSTILSKGAEQVTPDLIANVIKQKVRLELNRESVPHLRLYNPYQDRLDIIKDPKARKFLKENMEAAKNLIDNIKRREETMCRVANYILTIQKESLVEGNYDIKTLTLHHVAEALNLHPSTISRAVSHKYIQINDKVVPLKNLLSHGMKKKDGEFASKTSIKNKIREIVNKENKAKPLTDKVIKEELEKEGIAIKRRTVAKYRESLKILPVHLRRKKRFS